MRWRKASGGAARPRRASASHAVPQPGRHELQLAAGASAHLRHECTIIRKVSALPCTARGQRPWFFEFPAHASPGCRRHARTSSQIGTAAHAATSTAGAM
jgi:hypothetical protein